MSFPPTLSPTNIIDQKTDWNALATFISVVGSVLISVCLTIHKSKCDRIKCCCFDIHRNVEKEDNNKDIENNIQPESDIINNP